MYLYFYLTPWFPVFSPFFILSNWFLVLLLFISVSLSLNFPHSLYCLFFAHSVFISLYMILIFPFFNAFFFSYFKNKIPFYTLLQFKYSCSFVFSPFIFLCLLSVSLLSLFIKSFFFCTVFCFRSLSNIFLLSRTSFVLWLHLFLMFSTNWNWV